jgi:hypothetical protein
VQLERRRAVSRSEGESVRVLLSAARHHGTQCEQAPRGWCAASCRRPARYCYISRPFHSLNAILGLVPIGRTLSWRRVRLHDPVNVRRFIQIRKTALFSRVPQRRAEPRAAPHTLYKRCKMDVVV